MTTTMMLMMVALRVGYRCKNAYRIPGMLLLTGSSFYFISEHNAVRTCNSYEDLAAAVIVSGEPSEQYLLLRGNSLSVRTVRLWQHGVRGDVCC